LTILTFEASGGVWTLIKYTFQIVATTKNKKQQKQTEYVDIDPVKIKRIIEHILIGILKKLIIVVRWVSGMSCDLIVENRGVEIPVKP
jgi:hypothetical protein